MPRKKIKHSHRPRHHRKRRAKGMMISQNMIRYEPTVLRNIPFPSHYRTKLMCSVYGNAPSSALSGTVQWAIPMNSSITPFGQVTPITSGSPVVYAGPSVATHQCTGFSTLCNTNFYRNFRVHSAKLEVDVMPQANGDNVVVTITPSVAATLPASVGTALSAAFTKTATFGNARSNATNKGLLSLSMSQHKFIGVSKRAIDDDLSNNYIGQYSVNPVNELWFVVNLNTIDNAIFTNALEFRFRVSYDIEFYNAVSTTLPQT